MKLNKLSITFLLVLLSHICISQMRYGTIVFERKTNLEKRFGASYNNRGTGGPGGRGGKEYNSSNKYLTEKLTLYFNDTISLFVTEPLENINDQQKTFQTQTLINFSRKTIETQINILGENFLIQDTLPKRTWKFTGKVRTIANTECKQAICTINDSTTIYAWFDTEVMPAVGPESYWDLPGAILGLAYEDGAVTYFAQSISSDFVDISQLYVRSKSKKTYSRHSFITEFAEKYTANYRLYNLIKDLLHFF